MILEAILIILFSFLAGFFFLSLFQGIPDIYKRLSTQGIPLTGGISIGLSFVLTSGYFLFLFKSITPAVSAIILSCLIILLFGLLDDFRESSVKAKFLAQLLVSAILILGGVKTRIVYIGEIANIIITLVWIIGIINAINLLDIMDGLAGGIAVIAATSFLIITLFNGDVSSLVLSLAVLGAVFSFLIRNCPPAKVYMGNSGSHFLGLVLAVIALQISYAPLYRKVALFTPLLILGFPIFDTTTLVFFRLIQKRSVFKKSTDHLALRFLGVGYSKKRTLLLLLLWSLFFSISGIIVDRVSNLWGVGVILVVTSVSIAITHSNFRQTKHV